MQTQNRSLTLYCNMPYTVRVTTVHLPSDYSLWSDLNVKIIKKKKKSNLGRGEPQSVIIWMVVMKKSLMSGIGRGLESRR